VLPHRRVQPHDRGRAGRFAHAHHDGARRHRNGALAALYAREDDFAFLQRTIDAIAVAADNQDQFQTLDMRFHIGIACAIGNITVLRLAKLLTGTLWAARKLLPTYGLETPDFTLDIHTTTLAALMSRNPANVAAVMDEDLAQLKHAWQRENQRTVGCAAC
jgi:DNA-binding FadR family transcriptional regulator